jgi:hypothetical protein
LARSFSLKRSHQRPTLERQPNGRSSFERAEDLLCIVVLSQ